MEIGRCLLLGQMFRLLIVYNFYYSIFFKTNSKFKKILLLTIVVFAANFVSAQATVAELKAQKADKEAKIAALQGEADALATQIASFPGWKIGALGTLGANFSQFNNWGPDNQNTFASIIGATGNAFANLDRDKFFWRNGANLVVQQTKLNTDPDVSVDFQTTADAFNINSLYGYKLTDKWAISALGDYRTTFLNSFNNPGFLDVGVGATWLPIPNAVVVFHPLNYNLVFADSDLSYTSSLGLKIVADYSRSLPMGLAWKTNLSSFISYEDPDNLTNWVWTNGVSTTFWKGLGVGLDFGFAGNKQLSYNRFLTNNALDSENFNISELGSDNDPLQSFWVLGLTYTL